MYCEPGVILTPFNVADNVATLTTSTLTVCVCVCVCVCLVFANWPAVHTKSAPRQYSNPLEPLGERGASDSSSDSDSAENEENQKWEDDLDLNF